MQGQATEYAVGLGGPTHRLAQAGALARFPAGTPEPPQSSVQPALSWSRSASPDTRLSLQGAHVTVNARAEEDVEPECIMQKVARASGANYTFHRESSRFQDTGPQAPVVSAAGLEAGALPGVRTGCLPLPQPLLPCGRLPPPGFQPQRGTEAQTVTHC